MKLAWAASRSILCGLVVLSLVGGIVPPAAAWLTKGVLDSIVNQDGTGPTVTLALALSVVAAVAAIVPHIIRFLQQRLDRKVGQLTQHRLYQATGRFVGLSRFEDPSFVDRLRLAQQHGGATPGVVVASALSIARTGMSGAGFLFVLVPLAAWLPLMVLASAVPSLIFEIRHARFRAGTQWKLGSTERRELFYRELLTDVQAAKEIRLFGLAQHFGELMLRERRSVDRTKHVVDATELRLQTLISLLAALIGGVALIWAASAAAAGEISIGDVSLVVTSLAALQTGVLNLVREIGSLFASITLFGHYRYVVAIDSDLPVLPEPASASDLEGGIEFRDDWFRYAPEQPWALRGVSFTIPAMQSVGIVGKNGAGKSTIVKLLLRMYDPQEGSIMWDGVDLRDLEPSTLRSRIGAVFQDFMCYDLTAAENVEVGNLGSSRDEVEAAGAMAGADSFIELLPDRYDTMLSRIFVPEERERNDVGVTLSGGQWQRVALARAYLRADRDLLILDEPSSGLDAEAEHFAHESLKERRKGRTCLMISHRLGTLRSADSLVILSDGLVVDVGTHDELLARGGLYADLFEMQASGYVETSAI